MQKNRLQLILVFTSIYLLFSIVNVSAQNQTLIYGNFPKFKDTIATLSYSYVTEDGRIIYAPDTEIKNGKFEIVLSINVPTSISIDVNNENLFQKNAPGQNDIIVLPSDSITLDIQDYGLGNIIASGRGIAKFDFVKALIGERLATSRSKVPSKESISDYLNYTQRKITQDEMILMDYRSKLSDTEYNILLAKIYIEVYNLVTKRFVEVELSKNELKLAKDSILNSKRFKFLRDLDPKYVQALSGNYYAIMNELAYLNRIVSKRRKFNSEESNNLIFKYNILKEYYTGYKIKDVILGRFLIVRLNRKKIDETLENCVQDFLDNANPSTNIYKRVINLKEQSLNRLAKGSTIENYSFVDSLEHKKYISDFKGKITVLDFWFNGCYGCALITPQLNELKKYFTTKDVTFVSINIDKEKETWLRGIGKFAPLHAVHLNTSFQGMNHQMIKYFQITALPTLIILDKQGRIFNQRAMLPTLPDTKNKLIAEIEEALSL